MGHCARGLHAGEPAAERRGAAGAAAGCSGIVEVWRSARMDMSCAEADDRNGAGRRDAFGGSSGPAGLTGEDAEDSSLIDRVRKVAGLDPKDYLLCGDAIAFGKRPHFRIRLKDFVQERDDLSHATEQTLARWKDLHDGDGIEAGGLHRLSGAKEVNVGGVAGEDSPGGRERVVRHREAAGRPVTFAPRTVCISFSAKACASGSKVATQSAGTSTA